MMTVCVGHPRRAAIHTLGCRLNQAESALLAETLTAAGYALVPFGEPADLGIIHTCTVTREADAKSRKLVRQFIRANPHAYTAVIGCYAQMGPAALAAIPGIDLIIGNQEKLHLLDHVAAGKNKTPLIVRDRFVRDDFTIDFAATDTPLTRRANLKVQDGCDFMCSFCIIPFARGRARSREIENVIEEAESLVRRGARELVLTGVNLGLYDYAGRSILDVIDRLNDIEGLARIRVSSIEPTTVPEGLLERMADPGHRLVPYLHLPMQSGSSRVLEAMRRKYTREEFLAFARMAADRVPDIGIGTDILVGFPGETDADFEKTCMLFEESPCFYAHVFKYSEREGAAASRMPHAVDPSAAGRRSARVRRISAIKERAFL
ncbi:MAG TPA: tRNA (N(6)-L-threonylcarbamoyladenosine(37)-C(2))-methylthiotransferase MtaB, partial [Candidatus Hydrogenedentes bacterium]|nr:tRNA (N(6)-L-threonylcarbamoyladenosine(37)-C(2))-methylthiotransferase MtaB [Candidatus Hydrogenedentota bacterium]